MKLLVMPGILCKNAAQITLIKRAHITRGVMVSSPVELFHATGISWQTDMSSLDIAVFL